LSSGAPQREVQAPHAGPVRGWQVLAVTLTTALAYAATGGLALALAGPPGYASPLYPPAGIALVAAAIYGRAAWPGVLLGAFLVNTGLGLLRGQSGLALVTLPFVIALGAMLQAMAGAALLRRFVGTPLVLNAPRDILKAGLLGGLLACMISPSVATPALVFSGAVPLSAAAANWLTWWTGDTLGVLIAAPLVLTLIGRPTADWHPRRRTLGLPLLAALALLALAVAETNRLERARQQAVFEREADRLASETQNRLNAALHTLQALHSAARQTGRLDATGLREASRWWLAQPLHLQATGYSVRVGSDRLAAFEAEVRAQGQPGYRVFDRDEGRDRAARGEVVAIRHIEPAADNAGALGVNALSIPAAREAILATRDSGAPAATAAFRLTQSQADESGLVVYQALYGGAGEGEPASAAERAARFTGVVFVTLRAERALADVQPSGTFLRWCLRDADAQAQRPRLAGPLNCEQGLQPKGTPLLDKPVAFAGRSFVLRVWAEGGALPGRERETSWLITFSGMAAAAMLGALLLTVTGQQRRTELAVRAGTEELRGQVAERLQVEAALRESSQRLRSIVDAVPLGVIFMDPQGHLIECNPSFSRMTGREPQALLGRSVADFVGADDAAVIRRLRRTLDQGEAEHVADTVNLQSAAGEPIVARVSATALRDPQGRMVRMVGVVEDITERLRLEASEQALARAEAANRAKSEFLSRMSHELRTPLNAMIGFAQLLGLDREPALATHQQEWTQQIQRAGWHLLELINETLDLARIESGAVLLATTALEVAPLVAASQAMVAGSAGQRRVAIEVAVEPAGLAVLADPTRLRQVLTNLLSNAVKYNREGGSVRVSAHPMGPSLVAIEVRDTGLGMTDQQMAALFQPYNRLGREQTVIEGTGIGLVISRRLTELMGGTLEVSSTAGAGSTFRLTLPAAPFAEPPPEAGMETGPAPYQQRLVHYIEDNETNVEVMRGVLLQRSQVALSVSMLGLDGLTAVRQQRPDLILLDMQLPDISGLELLRHLKNDDDVADIPVIVVSADATPAHREQALTLGAKHYVTKPLEVSSFLQLVDDALEAADTRF
jgi:PAS domain S-box-containing protein